MKTRLLIALLLLTFYTKAQHNYDNQSIIFSHNGNLGVGTSAPYNGTNMRSVTIEAPLYPAIILQQSGNLTSTLVGFGSHTSLGAYGPKYLSFETNYAERMRISAEGKVGIGTTNPEYPLDVGLSNADWQVALRNGSSHVYLAHGANFGVHINTGGNDDPSRYALQVRNNQSELFYVRDDGKIGVGTTTPDAKLTVKGEIHAEAVNVDLNVPGPDYVFEDDYPLRSLEETEAYIKAHKHLPEVPSAQEMEAQGIDLAQMNMLLLKKIEELTLIVIDQNKRIQSLENQ